MTKPLGLTMRAAYARSHTVSGPGGPHTIKAGELLEAAYLRGASPSAAARKVFTLMLAKAGGDAWEARYHEATRAELQHAHQSKVRLERVLDELMSTKLAIRVIDENGQPGTLRGNMVADAFIPDDETGSAKVRWWFSETLCEALRRSDYYAELRSQVISALESRYSVELYELGCAYHRRHHPCWSGTLDEFRAMMGVPPTYRDWTDIKRRTLDAAKSELDFVAPFTLSWTVKRKGRAIERVILWFQTKDEESCLKADEELKRPRAGRKARRLEGAIATMDGETQKSLDDLRS